MEEETDAAVLSHYVKDKTRTHTHTHLSGGCGWHGNLLGDHIWYLKCFHSLENWIQFIIKGRKEDKQEEERGKDFKGLKEERKKG